MGRTAKKSDLTKKDLVDFTIGLTDAKTLKITKEELRDIKEIIPNKKYKIRATTGDRRAETFEGTLMDAIKRKKELNKASVEINNKNINNEDIMFMEGVNLYIDSLLERENRDDLDINTVFDHTKKSNIQYNYFFHTNNPFINTSVCNK